MLYDTMILIELYDSKPKSWNIWISNKLILSRTPETDRLGICNEDLGEPVCNRNRRPIILFAGEATDKHHYGTVHGAISAGKREAKRIVQLECDEKCNK